MSAPLQDILSAFQEDLHRMRTHRNTHAPKRKKPSRSSSVVKLPTIHKKPYYSANDSSLLKQLERLEEKMEEYQIEKEVQERLNERVIQQLQRMRQANRPVSDFHSQDYENFPPHHYQRHPAQRQNRRSQKRDCSQRRGPYSKPSRSSKQNSQKKGGRSPKLRKFRIAVYAVCFALIFPKFSRALTVHRFNSFKLDFPPAAVPALIKTVKDYILSKVCDQLLAEVSVSELDSLRSIEDEADKSQKKEQANKVVEFFLKVETAVKFVCKVIEKIMGLLQTDEFYQNNKLMVNFLAKCFVPDYIVSSADVELLNLHPQKGYSQSQPEVTKYLFIKFVFLNIVVGQNLLGEIGQRFEGKDKDPSIMFKHRVSFSFYIRAVIMKDIIQTYLEAKRKMLGAFPIPREELLPFPNSMFSPSPNRSFFSLQNSDVYLSLKKIKILSSKQVQKNKQATDNSLSSGSSEALIKLRAAWALDFKAQKSLVLSKQLPKTDVSPDHFWRHTASEIKDQRQKQAQALEASKQLEDQEQSDNLQDSDEQSQSSQYSSSILSSSISSVAASSKAKGKGKQQGKGEGKGKGKGKPQ